MADKRHRPCEIVSKLREMDGLCGTGSDYPWTVKLDHHDAASERSMRWTGSVILTKTA